MKPTDLDAVQKLCDAASEPGRWYLAGVKEKAFIDSARTLVPQMAAEIQELRAELAAERARTDALMAALPTCDHCTKAPANPATGAHGRGSKRWCDECVALAKAEPQALAIPNFERFLPRDYPRAEPLRAIAHARRAAGGEESGK